MLQSESKREGMQLIPLEFEALPFSPPPKKKKI